jgi:hypothetical protein
MARRGEQLLSKFLDFEDLSVSLERDVRSAVDLPAIKDSAPLARSSNGRGADLLGRAGLPSHDVSQRIGSRIASEAIRAEECELLAKAMITSVNIELDEPFRSSFVDALASLVEHYSSVFRWPPLSQQSEIEAQQRSIVDAQMRSCELDSSN